MALPRLRVQPQPPRLVDWQIVKLPAGRAVIGLTPERLLCRATLLRGRKAAHVVEEWQAQWRRTTFTPDRDRVKSIASLPLLAVGSKFQGAVWAAMLRIPFGATVSYGEIASRIGHPRAARGVGAACAACRLAPVIPCHRVIAAHGIGGYGPGGTALKRALLKAEGVTLDTPYVTAGRRKPRHSA